MGGFFAITGKEDVVQDVYFGVDYHTHLGKARAGLAAVDRDGMFQREIHNIENAPFRTKFDNITERLQGVACLGCISDADPQPLLIRSRFGVYAIAIVGMIANMDEVTERYLSHTTGILESMSGNKVNATEVVAALVNQRETLEEGIRFAQEVIQGAVNILILKEDGHLVAARDKAGRLPILVGRRENAFCVSFESHAYRKLDFEDHVELKSGEIAELAPESMTVLFPGYEEMKICAFLWTYYGYPTASYEGVNVEMMRTRNGRIMAGEEKANGTLPEVDYVCGVPDSGTPHAIGYAQGSGKPFARPFIKYTPAWSRSFIPANQAERNKVARMKQIPVEELIKDKDLLFVDDSIVRGTQLRETVDFLYQNGARSVHMRSACPPIMYACKYLNFSRNNSDMELLGRQIIMELEGKAGLQHIDEYADGTTERGRTFRRTICEKMHFDSLEYQSKEGVIRAIGLEPCRLCTYCWDGKE